MSTDKPFEDRRKALEDEFFRKEDDRRLAKLREDVSSREVRAEIKKATGSTDEATVDRLLALGVTGPTVAALSLAPLVAVAWADGEVQADERAAILRAASEKGLGPGSAAHDILDSWLAQRPADTMLAAWEAYTKALTGQLDAEQARRLKDEILGLARRVAEAAGGFLGIGKVSKAERDVLRRLEEAFG